MERLTYDFCVGDTHCWQIKGADNLECREVCQRQEDKGCEDCPIAKAFDHLAAIEDILGNEYDLDRLRELAQADREGRCVVLPPDDYTWTIRGDIIRGIIHANCRAAKKEAEAALSERGQFMPSKKENGRYKHGGKGTKLYEVWCSMRARCNRKTDKRYDHYGGRGISVCEEWNDFIAFRNWALKNGYQEGLTIDRIDNDGPYSPENCRWTTKKIQNNNQSTTTITLDEIIGGAE